MLDLVFFALESLAAFAVVTFWVVWFLLFLSIINPKWWLGSSRVEALLGTFLGLIIAGVLMLVGVFTLPVDVAIDDIICVDEPDCPCRHDAQCYGERLRADFTDECVAQIERLAVDGFQWTDRQDQPLFTEFSWVSRLVGNVTMKGQRAEFLPAPNVSSPATYECDVGFEQMWNDEPLKVLAVRVTPDNS